ncbi:probable flavin-containing monooxygenase 1 isoform X1 [Benincasa hispida]|uniref:probable flavin-containing monooxygenase 1 isoform X1 n=1 Tax=Benincasa hispida TaxID=102211 RepID=UPI001902191A|nr:probable flavin-containing monooxygenase 1 isoform X1 [Benincasa hispida]
MEPKKVGIIGAGISGLAACKFTLSKGLIPIVFEAKGDIGGVWTETLETTALQTPREMFQFSDFPWPKSVTEEFPRYNQVLDYLRSYAEHFGLLKHIRFNSRVLSIDYEGCSDEEMEGWTLWGGSGKAFAEGRKWRLNVVDETNGALQAIVVDFVVLCIGRFCDVPNIPKFPSNEGPEAFKAGKVLHSLEYSAMDFHTASNHIKDKRVTVVGFQKSALDIAMECANANGPNKPCTVLYKTEHWNLPNDHPWGIPLSFLYMNRFAELLIHKPGEGFFLYLLAVLLSPIRWLFSKIVETYVIKKHRLAKYGMVPSHSFLQSISACFIATLPEKFYDKVDEGSIVLKKSQSFGFCEEGIMIEGETKPIHSDLVILATGYRGDQKLKQIFASSTFRDYMTFHDSMISLYRLCIHPRIPQLAVVGFTENSSNLFTSEIRCRWLAEFMDDTFKLPSIKDMEKDIVNWEKTLKQYSGPFFKRACIAILHIWYCDQLCKDMGWNPRRKKGFFADLFLPYGPSDYASP